MRIDPNTNPNPLNPSANPDNRQNLPPVLFIKDVARLLRCSPVTIRRRLHAHEFPVAPLPSIDKKLRWSRRAILDWIDSGGSIPMRRARRRSA